MTEKCVKVMIFGNRKIEKTNTSLEEIHPYKSPKTKVVFVKMQGMLCTSDPKEIYITET